jgi:cellulose biosynthesis protein BcsQ
MRLRNGWRAGYAETCTSGSEGGSVKPGLETDEGARFLPNKTTLTLLLAASLAAAGFHVGIVDADKQSNATSLARPRTRFPANLTQVVKGEKTLREAMVQIRKRLWLVPSDLNLKEAIDHITIARDFNIVSYRVASLRQELAPTPSRERLPWWNKPSANISIFQLESTTDQEFLTPPVFLDFLFFDTPPQENDLTLSILDACDKVYIPVNMDQYSIDGLAQLISRIQLRFRDRPRKIKITGVIPNEILHRANNSLPMTFLESVWKHFPTLARRTIHYDDTIQVGQALSKVALEINRDARAVRELCALALELAGWQGDMAGIPFCELCDGAVERAQTIAAKEG